MRYFLLALILFSAVVVSILGFRGTPFRKPPLEIFPDMDRQAKIRPQTIDNFFPDRMASRLPVPGTVSRGSHFEDTPMNTGRVTGTTNFVETNPMPLSEQVMARGRERFQINCQPCHGPLADGNGVTKKFGMAVVANLHDKRIVSLADGEIFSVITNGRNLMGAYGPNVPVEDRWAIIAKFQEE